MNVTSLQVEKSGHTRHGEWRFSVNLDGVMFVQRLRTTKRQRRLCARDGHPRDRHTAAAFVFRDHHIDGVRHRDSERRHVAACSRCGATMRRWVSYQQRERVEMPTLYIKTAGSFAAAMGEQSMETMRKLANTEARERREDEG
jgi:hypothetical protein